MTPERTQRIETRLLMGLMLLVAGLFTAWPSSAQDLLLDGVEDAEVFPRIIAESKTIQPGQTTTIAVHFDIKKKWHLYWTNPEGDGATPGVVWDLPKGYTISGPRWPAPETFLYVNSNHYGYENKLSILFDLTVPENASGEAKIGAGLTWLVCNEFNCVPSPGFPVKKPVPFTITLPVSDQSPERSVDAGLIEASEKAVPRPAPGWSATAEKVDGGYTITIEAPTPADAQALKGLRFYNDTLYAIDPNIDQPTQVNGSTVTLSLKDRKTDAYGSELEFDKPIEVLTGVLTSTSGFGSDGHIAIPVGDRGMTYGFPESSADQDAAASNDEDTVGITTPGEEAVLGFLPALGFAFLGGMILNLMPCVFPVLSIKILGFVQVAGEKPSIVRRHGYAFGIGVMVSFWILIAIILALRTTIDLSWGFQLQNPIFMLSMILLCFLVGLNLLGTFEIGVGLSAKAGQASQTVAKDGYGKSFFTGVLATLIATPCAAPFMAPAVGAAFIMPNLQAFLVFSMLGAGMATPYVVLSCFPKLLDYLPKPGPWMESFKQAMAFPMFATAGWLSLSYIKLIDIEIADVLLMSLSAIALGMWVLGKWSTPSRTPRARWIGRAVALFFVAFGLGYVYTTADKIVTEREARELAREAGEYVYEWVDFSPEKVDALRAEGRPVLIDFTASWCGICQDNKRRVLRTDASAEFYEKHNVALIEADFTAYRKDISEVLTAFNRNSVPLYLLYPPGEKDAKPIVLPNLLTSDTVMNAIQEQSGESEESNTTASR